MTQANIVIYTGRYCGYCSAAKRLLDGKGLDYTELSVDGDHALRAEMEERSRRFTVPQIFIGATHVGGYDDIAALERQGRLDELLEHEKTA